MTASQTPHVPVLDGVRGLAIAFVILHHLAQSTAAEFGGTGVVHDVLAAGWVGVDLFFVLSGFLITGILLDTREQPRFFRTFYARRMLRIFPLYYAALLLATVLAHTVPSLEGMLGDGRYAHGPWLYLTNLYMATHGWELYGWMGHLWSLAIEEHFYLVWPVVVYACSRRRLWQVAVAIICVMPLARVVGKLLGLGAEDVYLITIFRLGGLATGGLLALVVRDTRAMAVADRLAPVAAIAASAGLAAIWTREGHYDYRDGVTHSLGLALLAMLFGALLYRAVRAPQDGLSRLLNLAPLRFLGQYSYGLYILHTPIFTWWFHTALGRSTLHDAGLWSPVGASLVAVTAAMAAALLSWVTIEAPFLRLKRWFPYAPLPGASSSAPVRLPPGAVAAEASHIPGRRA